jgi:hypothetical protein
MQIRLLMAAGLAAAALAGCAGQDRTTAAAPTTTTTSVTRDYWGNPVSQSTVTRDAYGNPIATSSQAAPGAAPVYSGAGTPPEAAVPAPGRDCSATLLHQDRPGGSDYDPRRGYSCD